MSTPGCRFARVPVHSAEIEDDDSTIVFAVSIAIFGTWFRSRLIDIDRQLEARLLVVSAATLVDLPTAYLVDDERRKHDSLAFPTDPRRSPKE
jgi:hypothetical protein